MSGDKEVKDGDSDHINIQVLGQDNVIVQFKIKRHIPLRKVMKAYCDRVGLDMGAIRFRYDGEAVSEDDTPLGLEMKEGDGMLEVFLRQTGLEFHDWTSYF